MRATTHWRLAGFACCIIGFWLTWLCLSEPKLYFKYTLLEALTFNKAAAARAGILGSRVFGGHRTWSTDAASKAIVIGKLSTEDTAWTSDLGTEKQARVYVVNDTTAPLHKTQNKGREANAYLTYILEHYHDLPEIAIFVHAHRNGYPQAWHTEGAGNDIVDSLRRLNTAYAVAEGYTNLRCNRDPGCSVYGHIRPYHHINDKRPWDRDAAAEVVWLEAWPQLFADIVLPHEIAAPCCAQFAVSRQQRPLTDYQRFHAWLMQTELSDDISGRVMEYAWHIIFGKNVVQRVVESRSTDIEGTDRVVAVQSTIDVTGFCMQPS